MKRTVLLAFALASTGAYASTSNDIGFDHNKATSYCEDLADSYQVLNEDRNSYLSNCVADYRDNPPGDEGSDVSPHAASY